MPPNENQNQAPDQFSQIVERLKEANNVLVTVKSNPSVDQLAACIALTIALNKQGKHATAVFSGDVPSTIEFLEPDKTLEKNTDSLRDFIISLDKSKADKLRYKVEDSVVKIFITPYKTSISDQDLEFSQGDFNVDAVVALGVHDRNELDQAILAHGRILHDATVTSINIEAGPELGSINWLDGASSSLCEMVSDLVGALGDNLLDMQISTALLTGVVAETDRFRNEKASPHTMSVSGTLMAAGASTQLVASKLEEPEKPSDEIPEVVDDGEVEPEDHGTIEIEHAHEPDDNIHIDDQTGKLQQMEEIIKREAEEATAEQISDLPVAPEELASAEVPIAVGAETSISGPSMILEPPTLGSQLTANSVPEHEQYAGTSDPLSTNLGTGAMLNHQDTPPPEDQGLTLSDIEKSLNGSNTEDVVAAVVANEEVFTPSDPAQEVPPAPEPDYARDAVQRAVDASAAYTPPEPTAAMGSTAVNLNIEHDSDAAADATPPPPVPPPMITPGV